MAGSLQPLNAQGPRAGLVIAAGLAALTVGTLALVAARALGPAEMGPADWAALRFTTLQAFLSATLATVFAIPLARALARRQFVGRGLLITLFGAPFLLPAIVAVLGLLAVWGRAGPVNQALLALGLPTVSIYGMKGVVLAHVFFNLPLATRLLLAGWAAIPAEHFRLAAQLGMRSRDIARTLEMPMLRRQVPGIFATIFLLSAASFAVALTLGGGPGATTLELAIWQAVRFDFDLGHAALLGSLQMVLCAAAAVLAWKLASQSPVGAGLGRPVERWDKAGARARLTDMLVIAGAVLLLVPPLLAVLAEGLAGLADLPFSVLAAALRSLAVALSAAVLTLALAVPLSLAAVHGPRASLAEAAGYLPLAASPMVLGTGLFLLTYPLIDPAYVALPVTAVINAMMALPFAMRALVPARREAERDFRPLADALGMRGWSGFRLAIWPRIRPAARFSAALAAALSVGDLGVVALFADPDAATLPALMWRLMGSYRMSAAAGTALVLVAMALLLFRLIDGGHGRAHA